MRANRESRKSRPWRDNVFVERVWRSAKYERIYLSACDGVTAARTDIAEYFDWYNTQRLNRSGNELTPEVGHCDPASQAVFLSRYSTGLSPCNPSLMRSLL